MNLLEMMQQAAAAGAPAHEKLAPEVEAVRLIEALTAFNHNPVSFKPGDVVRQKKACAVYHRLGDNDMAIVAEVIAVPIEYDHTGDAMERKDVVIGVLDECPHGAHLVLLTADSRRFELVTDFAPSGTRLT